MELLVLGGAGYIGSVVASQLVAADHRVTVADNLSKGHRDAVPAGAEFVECDLLDAAGLDAVMHHGFDAVLHFAALSLVGESVADPNRYFRTNVVGSINVLDAMRTAGIPRLVFSSTAAVYGEPTVTPISEDAPTAPTNPYGATKLAIDQAIGAACEAYDIAATSLRYFNVAGAALGCGERHDPETHLIPLVLQAAAGERAAITVFGTDYPTPDGTAVRDYIHVEDLGRAHLLALEALSGDVMRGTHRIYNLGNGEGFSVREVIAAAERVVGHPIPVEYADRRPGDPAVLVASSDRIKADLGWKPEKPDLESMIGDAWRFAEGQR